MSKKRLKASKYLAVFVGCESDSLNTLLTKQKNGSLVPYLNEEELDTLWEEIYGLFKAKVHIVFISQDQESSKRDVTKEYKDVWDFVEGVIFLAQQTIQAQPPHIPPCLAQNVKILHMFLCSPLIAPSVQASSANLCLEWHKKELPSVGLRENVLKYLLKTALNGTAKTNVHRLCEFHNGLDNKELNKGIRELIIQAAASTKFLFNIKGQNFLTSKIIADNSLVEETYQMLKEMACSGKKKHAAIYGKIFREVWLLGAQDTKQLIENCVQDIVEHVFLLPRSGMEMNKIGQLMVCFLYQFNCAKSPQIKKTFSQLSCPEVWKNLHSDNSVYRCNATDVFFHMYPLQRPDVITRPETQIYLDMQHEIIKKLLLDECPIIRCLAIRGVCKVIATWWFSIEPETRYGWMKIIIEDLTYDASSPEVRCCIYRSLKHLLTNRHSTKYLETVMPSLREQFADVSDKVRKAYIELLIKIKTTEETKHWNIVPLEQILVHLETEGPVLGVLLVRLVFDTFINKKKPVTEMVRRIKLTIVKNRDAVFNFFKYIKPIMGFSDAAKVIDVFLDNIQEYVKTAISSNRANEENISTASVMTTRQQNKRKRSALVENEKIVSENDLTKEKDNDSKDVSKNNLSLDNPLITQTLISIVGLLLKNYSEELENHPKEQKIIHDKCVVYFPRWFTFFKDSDIFKSLLFTMGFLPRKSTSRMIMIHSYYMSQVKKLPVDADESTYLLYVSALCSWGMGGQILELVMGWFNDAFRARSLNSTFTEQKQKRIKIQDAVQPKPLLGIKLLSAIFINPANHIKVMKNNYSEVFDLWNYLDRIKGLVEQRLKVGPLHDPLLTDEFIRECFLMYMKLTAILKTPEESERAQFDSSATYLELVDWAKSVLYPEVPEEIPENETGVASNFTESSSSDQTSSLVISILSDLLVMGQNMIDVGQAGPNFIFTLGRFTLTLLKKGSGLVFLIPSMCILRAVVEYCKLYYGKKDEHKMFTMMAYLIYKRCLITMSQTKYRTEVASRYIKLANTLAVLSSTAEDGEIEVRISVG
uniref:Condensin-2 complex subunit G2 n=1 Tax=Timema douglasi TaxID=61478 RepID=A0A7R8VAY5_TIMDO|nr:unnamed protein product [Timema douglasi]